MTEVGWEELGVLLRSWLDDMEMWKTKLQDAWQDLHGSTINTFLNEGSSGH
jgi:hypothetical protein